jgi:hypothetical protein
MMKFYRLVVVMLVFVIVVFATENVPAADHLSLKGYTVEMITTEFRRLDPFVSYKGKRQILDRIGASAVGIPDVIIALAQQLVEYQNRMRAVAEARNLRDVRELDIPMEDYPLLLEFYIMLQGNKPSGQVTILAPDTHPCGTYSHPVPDYTPPRYYMGWYVDAHNTLLSWSFHQTVGYACGQDPFIPCERDYTRGRGYSGPWGYCSSPRFRDQGTRDIDNHRIWIQYGEPNPEIFSYVWPYWDWGFYVRWWHNTY